MSTIEDLLRRQAEAVKQNQEILKAAERFEKAAGDLKMKLQTVPGIPQSAIFKAKREESISRWANAFDRNKAAFHDADMAKIGWKPQVPGSASANRRYISPELYPGAYVDIKNNQFTLYPKAGEASISELYVRSDKGGFVDIGKFISDEKAAAIEKKKQDFRKQIDTYYADSALALLEKRGWKKDPTAQNDNNSRVFVNPATPDYRVVLASNNTVMLKKGGRLLIGKTDVKNLEDILNQIKK